MSISQARYTNQASILLYGFVQIFLQAIRESKIFIYFYFLFGKPCIYEAIRYTAKEVY